MSLPAHTKTVIARAGLSAAVRLVPAQRDAHVREADRCTSGRLPTERVHGFGVDRGSPVLSTGHPRAADLDRTPSTSEVRALRPSNRPARGAA